MTSLFANDPPPQASAPPPSAPPTMPDPQSPDAMAAKRRTQQQVMGRAGRSSTILSTAMSRGGAGDYSASKLGSAT